MRRKPLILITGTLALAAIILVALFQFSTLPNRNKNGFTRTWAPGIAVLIKEKKIEAPLEKIVGATSGHYFFAVPNRQGVIMLDSTLSKQDTMVYGLPLTNNILTSNSVWIDSPDVNFFANNVPALFYGKLNSYQMDSIPLGNMPFTRATRLSPDHIVLRTLTSTLNEQVFQKRNSHTGEVIIQAGIIPSQQAGGFESDGMLFFNKPSHQLFYIQYYSNLFYCIDTNLNILYTARTIDTTHSNATIIERTRYKDGDKIAPGTSRVTVNQASCIGDGFLFVLSGLKADNEKRSEFIKNGVIDLYRIDNGRYAGSFHLPYESEEKISSIWVQHKILAVLYKSRLCLYRLMY